MRRLLLPLLALAVLALACSDDRPPAEPTPVPCPVEAYICERAGEFADKLLVEQDFDWIVENYAPNSFAVCNEESLSFPRFDPSLCEGAGLNEELGLFTISGDSSRNVLADDYAAALQAWVLSPVASGPDNYGPATPDLYTFACTLFPNRPICGSNVPGEDEFMLIFSKIPAGSTERRHLFLRLTPGPGGWKISGTHIGQFDQARFLAPALQGGDILGFYGPPGQTKTFFSWPR